MSIDEKEENTSYVDNHPSYGLIQFNRVSGQAKLFGTHLQPQHYISLTIKRGESHVNHGEERYYASEKSTLIKVNMSASQFSELITTMNMGMGVPCTLRYVKHEGEMPYPPSQESVTERAQTYFKQRMRAFSKDLKDSLKEADSILDKTGTLTKTDRARLKSFFAKYAQEIQENIPFFLTEYEEAAQKIVTQAKLEFDSFVTHAAMQVGLDRIKQSGANTLVLDAKNNDE